MMKESCEQLGVSCTETLGADPRTDDDYYGHFWGTLGATPRTHDDYCEPMMKAVNNLG